MSCANQGFELKRRGELKLIKVFQSEVNIPASSTPILCQALILHTTVASSFCPIRPPSCLEELRVDLRRQNHRL